MVYGEGVVVVAEEDCEPGCKCPSPYLLTENGTCVYGEECGYCLDKDGVRLPFGYEWTEPENCREWSLLPPFPAPSTD